MKIQTKEIFPHCFFGSKHIEIGRGTFINYNCFFDGAEKIQIGENCRIAMNCTFITSSHEFGDSNMRAAKGISMPIQIGDGCWIGANATILPGITIGNGTVIAAGSVVTKDCDSNAVYAGMPARKIRDL